MNRGITDSQSTRESEMVTLTLGRDQKWSVGPGGFLSGEDGIPDAMQVHLRMLVSSLLSIQLIDFRKHWV